MYAAATNLNTHRIETPDMPAVFLKRLVLLAVAMLGTGVAIAAQAADWVSR